MTNSLPSTRSAARTIGSTFYYTGIACCHNHLSKRRTRDGKCCKCTKIYEETHKQKLKIQRKTAWLNHHSSYLETRRNYDKQHRQQQNEKCREYYSLHKEYWRTSDNAREARKRWKEKNKDYFICWNAARRARKLQATPRWAEKTEIRALYKKCVMLSEQTGVKHEVDHIIPLLNNKVCGLHCIANLQIIRASDNRLKSNTHTI